MQKSKNTLCRSMLKCLCFLSLLLAALSACTTHKGAGTMAPADILEVNDYIHKVVDSKNSRSIALAIITADGVTYYNYGKMADEGEPVNEYTLYEIGSITKTFTAILLSDMIKQGKMALPDPVQNYLPAQVTMPGGNAITLEHLATHNSGLPGIPDNLDAANPNPYAGYTAENLYTFLSAYTLTRHPGTRYEYSNLGSGLLAHVLTLVSGRSYEELVIERISQPLGMDDTRITLSAEQQNRFARGHDSAGRITANWDFDSLAGCGALRSTTADMARYVQANLGLYKNALYTVMQYTHQMREKTGQADLAIGLAWHILTLSGTDIIWHNGGTGGYRSFIGFIPSRKVGVVVLSNAVFDIDYIGLHLLAPEIPLPPVKATVVVAADVLKTYVGTYQLTPQLFFEVTLDADVLMVQLTGQSALPVYPESETDFFYKEVDAQITFGKDNSGKVTTLILHQGGSNLTANKIR